MSAQTKFLLDARDCASLIAPLSHLRVALAAAVGCGDFGGRALEYHSPQLEDGDVFGPTRAQLEPILADAREHLDILRRRLRRAERDQTVLGGELATIASVIDRQLRGAEEALAKGFIETHSLFVSSNLAASAMRLLTGQLERIAQDYVPLPDRTERYEQGDHA